MIFDFFNKKTHYNFFHLDQFFFLFIENILLFAVALQYHVTKEKELSSAKSSNPEVHI